MLPIRGESQGSRVMPARGKIQQMLFLTEPLRCFGIVMKADYLVHVSDIHVVLSKRYAERPLHPVSQNFPLLRSACMLRITQHDDLVHALIGQGNNSGL